MSLNVVLEEYKYVAGLIPMYRKFQIQTVGFSIALHTASLGWIINLLDQETGLDLISLVLSFLPWPTFLLISMFGMMEMRIIRASRFINENIKPQLLGLTNGSVKFEFKSSPGKYLTWGQTQLTSTLAQVILMAFPSLLAAIGFYVLQEELQQVRSIVVVSLLGCLSLVVTAVYVCMRSIRHEGRLSDAGMHVQSVDKRNDE